MPTMRRTITPKRTVRGVQVGGKKQSTLTTSCLNSLLDSGRCTATASDNDFHTAPVVFFELWFTELTDRLLIKVKKSRCVQVERKETLEERM